MKRMSKTVVVSAIIVMVLLLTACGSYSVKGNQYRYVVNDYEAYYIEFDNEAVNVSHNKYIDSSITASGKIAASSDDTSYKVEYGKNSVTVDGKTYNYELDGKGSHANLTFDSKFLGISSRWD